jgi:hypothetical protein
MATAHDMAADAVRKTTMSPSPVFFTSKPPVAATAWRSMEKWWRRNSSTTSGGRRDAQPEESTMSVNRTAMFSVLCVEALGRGVVGSAWRAMARSRATNSGDSSVPTSSIRNLR